MSDVRDVIIIGGGPAGYTAALYTARANLSPLVIEGFNWGGQLMITSDVENYPGYADGVIGPTMMAGLPPPGGALRRRVRHGRRHARRLLRATVPRLRRRRGAPRRHRHRRDRRQRAAVGSRPSSVFRAAASRTARPATARSSATRWSRSWAAATPRWRRRTFLTRFASKVVVIHRRDEFRASPIMVDRARENEKVEFVLNAVVDEVLGETGHVTGRPAPEHRDRRDARDRRRRHLRRGRPRPEHLAVPRLARPRRPGISRHRAALDARRTSPASSQPATCRITRTDKRSPQPGPGTMAALDAQRLLEEQRHAARSRRRHGVVAPTAPLTNLARCGRHGGSTSSTRRVRSSSRRCRPGRPRGGRNARRAPG